MSSESFFDQIIWLLYDFQTYFQCIQEVIKFIFCDSDATTIGLELSFIQAAALNDPRKIEKVSDFKFKR